MKKYTVLYAEDDSNIRSLYKYVLENYFFYVIEATNGIEAYNYYHKFNPQVLILDINMPILNGLELAKRIRQYDKDVKIIILTALDDTNILVEACELNLLKYLIKPVRTIEFSNIIKKLIIELDNEKNSNNIIKFKNNVIVNRKERILYCGDTKITITKKESLLLEVLIEAKRVLSYADIVNYVWEDNVDETFDFNKLRILVWRLNKKVTSSIIESSYGDGYYLNL